MPSIHLSPTVNFNELLQNVEQLGARELERFIEKVLALRARKIAPVLPEDEAELLKKINEGLPFSVKTRFDILEQKRLEAGLNEEEHREMFTIIDQLEKLAVRRVKCIGQLAQLRRIPARELMKQLGIPLHG